MIDRKEIAKNKLFERINNQLESKFQSDHSVQIGADITNEQLYKKLIDIERKMEIVGEAIYALINKK